MTPRAPDPALTRQALLDAASDLLDRGGREAVTLRDVGTGAGVSRTAPYRHFADKDDLLAAVAATAWAALADALRAAAARPAADGLRHGIAALVDLGRTRPHLYRLLFTSGSGGGRAPVDHATDDPRPDGPGRDSPGRDSAGDPSPAGSAPARAGTQALLAASSAAQDAFLVLVERAVGADRARPTAALLLAATHGVVDLDVGGNLPESKWGVGADGLLDLLVSTVAAG